MLLREELIQQLVDNGLNYAAASSRVTVATRRLKKQGDFEPLHDKEHNNRVSYTDEDAQKIRAKLGLGKPTNTDSEDAEPNTKSEHTEPKAEEKSGTVEVITPAPKHVDKSSQNHSTPSSDSVKTVDDLVKSEGPHKAAQEKVEKRESSARPTEKRKKQLSWVWFAGGALALVIVGWLIVRNNRRGGGENQGEDTSSPSPVNLAEQYRMY